MEWMPPRDHLLHASASSSVPSFKLVDSNNRVWELTDPLKRQLGASSAVYAPSIDDRLSAAELEEQRQLEQQLQVQKEEMCFISPLPRPDAGRRNVPTTSHAFTYGGSSNSSIFHSTPPLAPPVSPFASMALSAPSAPVGKAHNPFLSAKVERSPRLPSLNALRNSPGTHLKPLGIASRPPPLSLRSFSDVSTLSSSSQSPSPSPSPLHQPQMLHQHHPKAPLRSMSSSSLSSASSTSPMLYSQSLPGVSFLQDRRRSRMSFDGADRLSVSPEDEESGMRLLSSSVGRSEGSSDAMTAAANAAALAAMNNINARSGRVCRYANCSNIARSRGLCRTHGGGKRCSHPNCNKSAQANRKCIAHGGGTPCSFGDCEKTAQSRGLCKAHGGGARCKHPDCPKSSQSKGLCRGHGGGIKCKAEGCEKWVQKNGYCIKHGRATKADQQTALPRLDFQLFALKLRSRDGASARSRPQTVYIGASGWQLSEKDVEALVSSREVVFLTTLQDDLGTMEVKLRCVNSSKPDSAPDETGTKVEEGGEAPTGFSINWSSSEALQKDLAEKGAN
ncbi:hypothetical protein BBJ29_004351 [Phytophthora kernoviae]|uniref:WRKY19-like zinc finger domain-containing protein n=1 Tax=Phytophthora kernoviae TaxID=325452 RepID=A0A3F2S0S5_9STRA|nr:hypothetical protein BBJ29_004351 [Phytophthora kernoviae]RLN68004.1 hypothetical protein BBP00_00001248 [Phytophthora kernoviae]